MQLELRPIAPEIEHKIVLGEKIEAHNIVGHIGDQPLAIPLDSLFERLGLETPSGVDLYKRFRPWLVTHSVSLVRRKGFADAVSVGIEVEYQHDDETCVVVDLIPSPRFRVLGNMGTSLSVAGSLDGVGNIKPLPGISLGELNVSVGQLKCGAAASASVGFTANVITPIISATGLGSSRCEWLFERDSESLIGHDIQCWSVVLVPKRRKVINYRTRMSATVRTLFIPSRQETDWIPLTCSSES